MAAMQTVSTAPEAGRIQRIEILLRLVSRSSVLSAAACVLAGAMLYGVVPASGLVAWLAAALLVCAVRFQTYRVYLRNPSRWPERRWDQVALSGALAMGVAWGLLPLLGTLPLTQSILVAMLLCFVAQAATNVLALNPAAFAAFAIPLAAGMSWMVYLVIGVTWFGTGLLVLFLVALLGSFRENRHTQLEAIELARAHEQSFRRQRLIFDTAQTGIALTRNRIIADFNPFAAELLGYSRDELIGQSTRIFFHDTESWEALGNAAFPLLVQGIAYHGEVTLRTKAGAPLACEMSIDSLTPGQPDDGIVIMLKDVTERRRLEASLREALAQQQGIFDYAPVGIVFTRDRKLVTCNERMLSMFGYDFEDIVGREGRWLHASDDAWVHRNQQIVQAFSRGEHVLYEEAFKTKSGGILWCRVRGAQIKAGSGADGSAVFTFADIGDSRRMEERLRESRDQLDMVIHASRAGIWDWRPETNDLHFSARFIEILGEPPGTAPNTLLPIHERVHPEDRRGLREALIRHLKSKAPVSHVLRIRTRAGQVRWVQADGIAVHNEQGRAIRSLGTLIDITDHKEREVALERLALEDVVTGLPNRRLFEDRLEHAMTAARRNRTRVAVMLIDLDGFKSINDAHGHDAGDAVLRGVAAQLKAHVRAADTVARVGGDEFVVVAEGNTTLEGFADLARKLLSAVHERIDWKGQSLEVGASIGISLYPDDADHPAQLVRMADEAMYRVKESGRNDVRFFAETQR